jgi:uncharacterized membrane protein
VPTWLALLIVVLAVASRPIEVRLWRAGRISDRAVTVLLLGRFPVIVAIAALATGGPTLLTAALIGISVLPPVLFYRWMLGLVRDQRPEARVGSSDIDAR